VIFIVQNNGWAISTPQSAVTAVVSFAERAAAYGMRGVSVDGMDPFAVYDAVEDAVAVAREGGGPTLLEGRVVRFRGHFEGDPGSYRPEEELIEGRRHDPIITTRSRLIGEGLATDAELRQIEESVDSDVASAAQDALSGEMPGRERLAHGLYA
jgi:TPP-dependent pyruvate/acetoin dehydrogenase alpha subunit